jgi:NAD(P)-dependent dehydrogenase (short-subunit alcohol dehydrogenase family)
VVLTGATSGIGEATARLLVSRADALVLLGPEPEQHVAPVLRGIRASGPAAVEYVSADFTHLTEVAGAAREIASRVQKIDVLINDAGVPGTPARVTTADDFERTLQVNALAPALLTRLLVPALSSDARIVNVGSSAHHVERFDFDDVDLVRDYTPIAAYARAKLAMVTWSSLLAEELAASAITVVAVCPGLNDTPLSAAMMGRIGGPPSQGAARVIHAITADVASGSYLEDDRLAALSSEARDPENRERLAQLYWSRLSPFAGRGAAS